MAFPRGFDYGRKDFEALINGEMSERREMPAVLIQLQQMLYREKISLQLIRDTLTNIETSLMCEISPAVSYMREIIEKTRSEWLETYSMHSLSTPIVRMDGQYSRQIFIAGEKVNYDTLIVDLDRRPSLATLRELSKYNFSHLLPYESDVDYLMQVLFLYTLAEKFRAIVPENFADHNLSKKLSQHLSSLDSDVQRYMTPYIPMNRYEGKVSIPPLQTYSVTNSFSEHFLSSRFVRGYAPPLRSSQIWRNKYTLGNRKKSQSFLDKISALYKEVESGMDPLSLSHTQLFLRDASRHLYESTGSQNLPLYKVLESLDLLDLSTGFQDDPDFSGFQSYKAPHAYLKLPSSPEIDKGLEDENTVFLARDTMIKDLFLWRPIASSALYKRITASPGQFSSLEDSFEEHFQFLLPCHFEMMIDVLRVAFKKADCIEDVMKFVFPGLLPQDIFVSADGKHSVIADRLHNLSRFVLEALPKKMEGSVLSQFFRFLANNTSSTWSQPQKTFKNQTPFEFFSDLFRGVPRPVSATRIKKHVLLWNDTLSLSGNDLFSQNLKLKKAGAHLHGYRMIQQFIREMAFTHVFLKDRDTPDILSAGRVLRDAPKNFIKTYQDFFHRNYLILIQRLYGDSFKMLALPDCPVRQDFLAF
ncbi:MAG: hypothetical protein P1V18_04860 [Candidatus Gracilibacteria bacterium]|nr:hypothetical protein [Candidatus Gracilibacteria bacterium]